MVSAITPFLLFATINFKNAIFQPQGLFFCRCDHTQRLPDGKAKGRGNRKNGNRYLSWAFSEAAHDKENDNINKN
jgi:hypothetical protein